MAGAPSTSVDISGNDMFLVHEQSSADVRAVMDEVRFFGQKTQAEKSTVNGTRFIGSVPITVHHEWMKSYKQQGYKDWTLDQYLEMKFNSSEYSKFRDDMA